ncbi:MAG: response regulator [Magnetovibrio sp.]|nr:response regulator [Magnetovibrio sp.]
MAKILVIDDNPTNLQFVVECLGPEHEVVSVGDGAQGLDLFKTQKFDLLITDIIMPDKNGFEVIREIRAQNAKIPIIAISGGLKSSSMDLLKVIDSIRNSWSLAKPFTVEQLSAVVQESLS